MYGEGRIIYGSMLIDFIVRGPTSVEKYMDSVEIYT